MRYLEQRVEVICRELEELAVVQKAVLDKWEYKKGTYLTPEEAERVALHWEKFNSNKMHWYGPDQHYWFRCEFTVPDSYDGKALWMNIRTQIEEWDDAKNPQFLVFVNGVETQGGDMNHRRVLLAKEATKGDVYKIDLQAYTGTLHTEFNLFAEMLEIDPMIEHLYYDLYVPLKAFPRMNKDDKVKMEIEHVLNSAINILDLRQPYSKGFHDSVKESIAFLEENLYSKMGGYKDIIATCIGHTHIDVAWWWTVAQTREKVCRSFATVLKLMEEYPDYTFMSSQPQLYAFLKERYPRLYDKIKERVAEGRWEPEGGMWVEADCNLTSGESLVRQFLHGKKFFKDEFGVDNKVLWLPDVFGYSGALPQIMKKSGIDYFMTTKLAWNQYNKMPHDTFMWKGIDGTEILTHFITTLGVGQPVENFFTTYNGMLHPDAIMGAWDRYQDKLINDDILISYGYGDGGGGPTREMLETSKRMSRGVKGIPKVRQEKVLPYFEELEERVMEHPRLGKWEGEFYFEYHRGTYTSMARNKRANRKSELMLMDLELLSVLANKQIAYPYEEVDKLWKTVLLNQFHDILPGTSIKEVYEVTKKEYEEIAKIGEDLSQQRLNKLTDQQEDKITVFNTLGFERSDYITINDEKINTIIDEEGNDYPVQMVGDRRVVYLKGIPSKGYKVFNTKEEVMSVENNFSMNDLTIETPYYHIDLDENGLFESIYDKCNEREIVQKGKKANIMRVYEDKPMNYDNWDIEVYYTEKFWDVTDLQRLEWKQEGHLRATLEIEREFCRSKIIQKIHFYSENPRIDFETYVDWKECQHLLKVHLPMDIHTDEATFDIQFGNVKRKTHKNTSWDEARFESCAHKWIDLSEGNFGVSLLNDCKYGHSVNEGDMALTLIKSGNRPNPTTDQEEHFFTYALYPHAGDWRQGKTVFEAAKLNQPMIAVRGAGSEDAYSFASIDHDNVIVETIKGAENQRDIIIRVYECENSRTKAHIKLGSLEGVKEIKECNLMEEDIENIEIVDGGFDFVIKPYEIKTFKLVF